MEQKHVGFLERHVEKFVLGVCALIAILIVVFYAVGEPYAVKLESKRGERTLRPGEVEPFVAEQANRLEQQIEKERSPLPELSVPTYTENFKERFGQQVVAVSRFAVPPGVPGISPNDIKVKGGGATPKFAVPEPPRPSELATRTGYGALAPPENAEARSWYEKRFGAKRPWDVRYVTVGVRFDMGAWKKRLRNPATKTGDPIPEQWWSGLLAISEVRLERQVYNEKKGEWSDKTTLLPPLPHVPSYRDLENPSPTAAEDAVVGVKRNQHQLVQPALPKLARGVPWQSPYLADENLSVAQRKKLLELNRKIRKLEQKNEKGGSTESGSKADSGRQRAAPRVNRRGRAAERGGRTGPEARGAGEKKMSKLERLKKRRRELLGGKTGGHGAVPDPEASADEKEQGPGTVTVWRHDITAKPGRRYRYRVRVGVLNPLFQRNELTADQRQKYRDKLTLLSPASEWSDPVQIPPNRHFFVVGANQRQRQVSVEVWRLFGGAWRSREFTVAPGDPVGKAVSISIAGQERQMRMRLDLLAVDLVAGVPAPGTLEGETNRLIYQRLDTNRMGHRDVALDQESPTRQRLRVEAARYGPQGQGQGQEEGQGQGQGGQGGGGR